MALSVKLKKGGLGHVYSSLAGGQPAQKSAMAVGATDIAEDDHKISWQEMNIKELHAYRQAHHLDTPSAFKNPHGDLILANAASKGLYSPDVVAAHRKRRELLKKSRNEGGAILKERTSSRLKAATNGVTRSGPSTREQLGKQNKEQLALAVRKHFNDSSVSEGDVVARFAYVVRHKSEGDKAFRMRFYPG